MHKDIKKCADNWERWVVLYTQGLLAIYCAVSTKSRDKGVHSHSSLAFLIDLHSVLSVSLLSPGSKVQDHPLPLFKPEDVSLSQRADTAPDSHCIIKVGTACKESPNTRGVTSTREEGDLPKDKIQSLVKLYLGFFFN